MSVRWIAGLSFVWVLGTIVSLIIEGAWLGAEELNLMNSLTGYSVVEMGGITGIPKMAIGFFTHGLPKLISWDYAFFTGDLFILRIIMAVTFSGAVIWGLIQVFTPVMQGILSRFIR